MLTEPRRYCAVPRCPHKATIGKYCGNHQGKASKYGRPWRRIRQQFLNADPENWICKGCGVLVPVPQVDHIESFRGDVALRDDLSNLQTLCKPCHQKKTDEDRWGVR